MAGVPASEAPAERVFRDLDNMEPLQRLVDGLGLNTTTLRLLLHRIVS